MHEAHGVIVPVDESLVVDLEQVSHYLNIIPIVYSDMEKNIESPYKDHRWFNKGDWWVYGGRFAYMFLQAKANLPPNNPFSIFSRYNIGNYSSFFYNAFHEIQGAVYRFTEPVLKAVREFDIEICVLNAYDIIDNDDPDLENYLNKSVLVIIDLHI